MLLLGWAAIRDRTLPVWFACFTLLVGIANVAALVFPPPSQLLSIPWFIALGIVLLRGGSDVRP